MDTKDAKHEFESVLNQRQEIMSVFDVMRGKIATLKKIYGELIGSHTGDDYMFGMDALHFQNELIEKDYIHLRQNLHAIERRLYCEYYTLYKQIQRYVRDELEDKRLGEHAAFKREFPTYKHLGPTTTTYDVKVVIEIYAAIEACIMELETTVSSRESVLRQDKQHSQMGLNIHALVYREEFTLAMMRARLRMFYDYLHTFFLHHTKYLSRLLLKAKLQMGIVNEDILLKQFNQGTTVAEVGVADLAKEITPTHIPKKVASPTNIVPVEEQRIRSYVDYDGLPPESRETLNGIIAAGGGSGSEEGDSDADARSQSDPPDIVAPLPVFSRPEQITTVPEESEYGSQCADGPEEFHIQNGSRVLVEGYATVGTLRFYGAHHANKGKRCGVELDEPCGKNNGTVGGHVYFTCKPMHGVLVAPYKVSEALDSSDDEH